VELMPTQRAEVFELIKAACLEPSDFGWRTEAVTATRLFAPPDVCSVLVRTRTPFFHKFVILPGGKVRGSYSPGRVALFDAREASEPWRLYVQSFVEWLGYLKRELAAPNPWEDLAKRMRSLPNLGSTSEGGNAPFSPDETQRLRSELDGMREQIQQSHQFNREQATMIVAEFEYIKVALDRLGRFDWRKFALGALCDLAVRLGQPLAVNLLLRLAGRLLGAPAETVDQLPTGEIV